MFDGHCGLTFENIAHRIRVNLKLFEGTSLIGNLFEARLGDGWRWKAKLLNDDGHVGDRGPA